MNTLSIEYYNLLNFGNIFAFFRSSSSGASVISVCLKNHGKSMVDTHSKVEVKSILWLIFRKKLFQKTQKLQSLLVEINLKFIIIGSKISFLLLYFFCIFLIEMGSDLMILFPPTKKDIGRSQSLLL